MAKTAAYLIWFFLIATVAEVVAAEEQAGHDLYRVSYYDLGILLDSDADDLGLHPPEIPLMIIGTATDIFSGQTLRPGSSDLLVKTDATKGGALATRLMATEKITILGSFGVVGSFLPDKKTKNDGAKAWEANLGLAYNFYGRLSYQMNLGYLDTGSLFTDRSSYQGVEEIYMISNSISLSF